jgi:hypothetical protein
LVPFVTSAAFAATGSVGYALLYPIAVPAVCFVLALFLMPASGNRKRLKQQPSKADHVRGRSAPMVSAQIRTAPGRRVAIQET